MLKQENLKQLLKECMIIILLQLQVINLLEQKFPW